MRLYAICPTFQLQNHSTMVMNLFEQMFWSFSLVFLVCNFGHKVSIAFEETGYAFDQINWYLFPYEMWNSLPTIIVGVQQPAKLTVFGKISCSREDFKNVSLVEQNSIQSRLIVILFSGR